MPFNIILSHALFCPKWSVPCRFQRFCILCCSVYRAVLYTVLFCPTRRCPTVCLQSIFSVCSVIQAANLLLVFFRRRLVIVLKHSVGKNGRSRVAGQSPPRSADVKNYRRETKQSVCMLLWRGHEQLLVLP